MTENSEAVAAKVVTLESELRARLEDPRALIAALSISADRVFLTFGDVGPHRRIIAQVKGNAFEIVHPEEYAAPVDQEDADEDEDEDAGHVAGIYGSNVLPAMVEIAPGSEVQLGAVVARAHAESGLTADEWNALEGEDREARLAATVDAMKAEAARIDPAKYTKAELVAMADAANIDVTGATKAEIAELLNEAPKTE